MKKIILPLLLLMLSGQGCLTLFDSEQVISVESVPQGAVVSSLDSGKSVTTDSWLRVSRDWKQRFRVISSEKNGREPRSDLVEVSCSVRWMDLLGASAPFALIYPLFLPHLVLSTVPDLVSGAAFECNRRVKFKLEGSSEPQRAKPVCARVAVVNLLDVDPELLKELLVDFKRVHAQNALHTEVSCLRFMDFADKSAYFDAYQIQVDSLEKVLSVNHDILDQFAQENDVDALLILDVEPSLSHTVLVSLYDLHETTVNEQRLLDVPEHFTKNKSFWKRLGRQVLHSAIPRAAVFSFNAVTVFNSSTEGELQEDSLIGNFSSTFETMSLSFRNVRHPNQYHDWSFDLEFPLVSRFDVLRRSFQFNLVNERPDGSVNVEVMPYELFFFYAGVAPSLMPVLTTPAGQLGLGLGIGPAFVWVDSSQLMEPEIRGDFFLTTSLFYRKYYGRYLFFEVSAAVENFYEDLIRDRFVRFDQLTRASVGIGGYFGEGLLWFM